VHPLCCRLLCLFACVSVVAVCRQHPAPRAPVSEPEEGVTELLPPQKKNTAKYYAEDLFGLTAAAHSDGKHLDVLKDELKGPSKFFSQLTVTNIVKLEKESVHTQHTHAAHRRAPFASGMPLLPLPYAWLRR
jgi:hypothetical protein